MNVKRFRISFALAIAFLAVAGAVALVWALNGNPQAAHAQGTIRYVAPGGNCGTASPCYSTVQEAVDAAQPGDEIRIAAGTYTDLNVRPRDDVTTTGVVTQVVYVNKTVTLRGGYTTTNWTVSDPEANPTTLDAQGRGRVLYVTGNISPTIKGLRITSGNAAGLGGSWWFDADAGGGVYVYSHFSSRHLATICNNYVFSNTAHFGGGLYLSIRGSARLSDNVIYGNVANGDDAKGGGVYLSVRWGNATLSGNTISSNTVNGRSASGGGLWLSANARLSGNTIFGNTATDIHYHSHGGGATVVDNVTLTGNTITSNTADYGGGLYSSVSAASLTANTITLNTARYGGGLYLVFAGDAVLTANTITSNTASLDGGGVYLWRIFGGGDATLSNNIIADNTLWSPWPFFLLRGSGLYIMGASPRLLHTTIARNTGGDGSGVYVTEWGSSYSTVALTNTILVSHTVGITVAVGNTVTLEATLWGTDTWANNTDWGGAGAIITGTPAYNYWGDPAFVNPDAADYHIGPGSEAVDHGVEAGVSTDIDNEPRFYGDPDLGADEYWPPGALKRIYLPLVMRNFS